MEEYRTMEALLRSLNRVVSREIVRGSDFEPELKYLSRKLRTILAQLRQHNRFQTKSSRYNGWLKDITDAVYGVDELLYKFAFRRKLLKDNDSIDELSSEMAREIQVVDRKLMQVSLKGIRFDFHYREPLGHPIRVVGWASDKKFESDITALIAGNDDFRSEVAEMLPQNIAHSWFAARDKDKETFAEYSIVQREDLPQTKETPILGEDDDDIPGMLPQFMEGSIIGRDDDRSKVVGMLLESKVEEDPLSVVFIYGRDGIGKTTLARMVYEDETVIRSYQHRIWVYAADFSVTRILKGMLDGLMQQNDCATTNIEDDDLIQRLTHIVQGDKYLLVLDNACGITPDNLHDLRNSLLGINAYWESRILVTTRDVLPTGTGSEHHLKTLSDDESWSIFHQRAFAFSWAKETANTAAIGKKIVKRCGGLPLALKTLGSLMRSKEESEWLSIEKSKSWHLSHDQMPALKVCLDHLPLELKHCFLYCSIFPEDFKFEKNNLIQLWIAQGFIEPPEKSNLVMEDVGNDYFKSLLWIFFQDTEVDKFGNITHCKMHGLIHELAKHVSYTELLESQSLSLASGVLDNFLIQTKYLRVLILECTAIKVLPEIIGKLQHLRYFDVSNTEITTFPASITKLYNLLTLRLMDCERFEKFPKGIEKLVSLRHLYCNYYGELPRNIKRLTSLQTLPYFRVGEEKGHQIEELGPLNELGGELELFNLELVRDQEEANRANLLCKNKLQGLLFMWTGERKSDINDEDVLEGLQPPPHLKSLIITNFLGGKFPSWMKMMNNNGHALLPQSLVTIELINCTKCEHIPSFGELPFLKYLTICRMHNVKCIATEFYRTNEVKVSGNNKNIGRSLFPSLEEFYLEDMENLMEWTEIADGSVVFPRLQTLFIEACHKLMTAPSHFPCLKELHILSVGSEVLIAQVCSKGGTLKTVVINVPELTSLPKEIFQNNKKNLTRLSIDACIKLSFIPPDGLLMLTSLEYLKIKDCPKLLSIPSIDGLTSLQTLHISNCDGITNLPIGLWTCTSLQKLLVDGCPNLTRPITEIVSTQKTTQMFKLHLHQEDGLSADDSLPSVQTYERGKKMIRSPYIHPIAKDIISHSNTEIVMKQLKFNYDGLRDVEMMSVFLYCALLISKNHKIDVSAVIKCCIQAGLIDGDVEDACKRGDTIVELLVSAGLLQRNEDDHFVTMHDGTRNFALKLLLTDAKASQFLVGGTLSSSLWSAHENSSKNKQLTSKNRQFFFQACVGLTEPPTKNDWEESNLIFLMANDFSGLPKTPSCPNLLALFLQKNSGLRVIPTSFFDSMPSLQVLNLSETRIKSLPQSLSKLINLRALILRNCDRLSVLPSEVGCLEKLEILDLQGTELLKLSNEVSKLIFLKHLEVSFYGSPNGGENMKLPSELIPLGMISNLANLEKLSVVVYPGERRWSRIMKSVILEVGDLHNLTLLSLYFPEVELLNQFLQMSLSWRDKSLTKFKFIVGQNVQRIVAMVPVDVELDYDRRGRCLRFVNIDIITEAVLKVLNRATAFYLDHHLNIGSLSELGLDNMKSLEFCIVRECPQMHSVIDIADDTNAVLPCLERLSIHYLWNLKKICEKIMPSGSFARLRKLSVHKCPHLSFIFSYSMLQCAANLEELVVEDCLAITMILNWDKNITPDELIIILPRLKKLTLHDLPGLVEIWKGVMCPVLGQMSFYNCLSLKSIGVDLIMRHSLQEIKAEKEWWDKLEWDDTALFLQLQGLFIQITDEDF